MLAWFRALLARLFGRESAQPAAPMPAPAPVAVTDAFRPGPPPPSGMSQLLALNGIFPESGPGPAQFTIGMIESFAGSYQAYGMARCAGGTLPILQYQPLAAVIGVNFGGDGMQNIGLPDLHGRVAVGGAPVGRMTQGALTITWLIASDAGSGAPMLGAVAAFGGSFAPPGWLACDGSILPVRENPALFGVIGTAFGGNGETFFQLPDLNGAAPVGVGPSMPLGGKATGTVDGLGLNYLINTAGPLAPASGNGAPPATGGYAGQVIAFAGAQIPDGWAACDGSVLQVAAFPTLFAAIGDIWGGDGKANFALPDLRGRMMPGS